MFNRSQKVCLAYGIKLLYWVSSLPKWVTVCWLQLLLVFHHLAWPTQPGHPYVNMCAECHAAMVVRPQPLPWKYAGKFSA